MPTTLLTRMHPILRWFNHAVPAPLLKGRATGCSRDRQARRGSWSRSASTLLSIACSADWHYTSWHLHESSLLCHRLLPHHCTGNSHHWLASIVYRCAPHGITIHRARHQPGLVVSFLWQTGPQRPGYRLDRGVSLRLHARSLYFNRDLGRLHSENRHVVVRHLAPGLGGRIRVAIPGRRRLYRYGLYRGLLCPQATTG